MYSRPCVNAYLVSYLLVNNSFSPKNALGGHCIGDDKNALTHGLEYIMRYILRVILSNNGTRRSRVLLLDKMTRKIYLIMYERPCVNVFNAR